MNATNERNSNPAAVDEARQIVATRVFDAPRELVFTMWTDPNHIVHWWGPIGFTNTIESMDVRPGGVWRFVMHSPDGTDYQNKIVYREVIKPERISYSHVSGPQFDVAVSFAEEGRKTRVDVRMTFQSAAQRDKVAREFGAVEGLNQTLSRLGDQLASLNEKPFIITRVFDAPRELVFKAWTEADRLMRWFGPKGFTMVSNQNDLRPGGKFLYCLRGADGREIWGRWIYREITPPQRMVVVQSFSNPRGGLDRHPLSPTWPLEMLTVVTLVEQAGETTVTVQWTPLAATAEERKTFAEGHASARQGWSGTFDQLAEYLTAAKSEGAM